jgi:transposase-like protein
LDVLNLGMGLHFFESFHHTWDKCITKVTCSWGNSIAANFTTFSLPLLEATIKDAHIGVTEAL